MSLFLIMTNKIFSWVASIISLIIFIFYYSTNSNADENDSKLYSDDKGILSLMYHRFNENKYPSTNIRMEVFDTQMKIIKDLVMNFITQKFFIKNFHQIKQEKKILITIDDGFKSFYDECMALFKTK